MGLAIDRNDFEFFKYSQEGIFEMKSIHFLYAALTSLLIVSAICYPSLTLFLLPLLVTTALLFWASILSTGESSRTREFNFSYLKRLSLSRLLPYRAHRSSSLADTCETKIKSLRTMSELVRKPTLRQRYLEACELSEVVAETIRRMPEDSSAALSFFNVGLAEIEKALEAHFAIHRSKEYKKIEKVDHLLFCDVKHCEDIILRLRRYQEEILEEGRESSPLASALLSSFE